MTAPVAAVAIGRNEGARLRACLNSLQGAVARVVYVDSGSTDASVALARALGVEVVILDPAIPFSAARARNAGFARLATGAMPDFVQFLDGDCTLVPGWIEAGRAALQADPQLGMVTGWRSEMDPQASVYNAMCDTEWHRPPGPVRDCNGDMMVRASVFRQIGGFDADFIASEDDEICQRIAAAGYRLLRLPRDMSRHDAAITRFSQWWRRGVRTGHGFAHIASRHPGRNRRERARAWVYGGVLPLLALFGAAWSGWVPAAVLALYAASWLRSARGLIRNGQPPRRALHHAVFLTLSKFANIQGMLIFHGRRLLHRHHRLIEYK